MVKARLRLEAKTLVGVAPLITTAWPIEGAKGCRGYTGRVHEESKYQ